MKALTVLLAVIVAALLTLPFIPRPDDAGAVTANPEPRIELVDELPAGEALASWVKFSGVELFCVHIPQTYNEAAAGIGDLYICLKPTPSPTPVPTTPPLILIPGPVPSFTG